MPARRFRSRFHGFPVLSCLISHAFFPGSLTRLFCPFPFVLPCFAPAAVPQVIPFQVSSPGPVPDFRFLSSASVLASHYSASVSSVQFFPFSPHSGLPGAQFRSRFPVFLRSFRLISHPAFLDSLTWLPVCFLSPFLASLPQPFHECLPSPGSLRPLLFGLFPFLPVSFVPDRSGSDYSAFRPFLSLLPDFPRRRFSRCATVSFVPVAFLFCPACFHAVLPIPVLSFLQFPFSALLFRVTGTTQLPASCFQLGRFPWLSL